MYIVNVKSPDRSCLPERGESTLEECPEVRDSPGIKRDRFQGDECPWIVINGFSGLPGAGNVVC